MIQRRTGISSNINDAIQKKSFLSLGHVCKMEENNPVKRDKVSRPDGHVTLTDHSEWRKSMRWTDRMEKPSEQVSKASDMKCDENE